MEDGVVASVPNGQRPAHDFSPVPRPALLPGTDSVGRASPSQTSNLWAPFQVPFLPPQLRHWQKRSGLSRSNPGPGLSSWPAPPPPSPPSSRRRGHRHDIVDRRLTDRPACFALPSAFSFFSHSLLSPFSPSRLVHSWGLGFSSSRPFFSALLLLCVHPSLFGSVCLV